MMFKKATLENLEQIRTFTDFWLAGRGLAKKAPGAVNDYFISPSQHKKYITKYDTWLAVEKDQLIAWAVVQRDGSMIHLLVAGDKRNQGIGAAMLRAINPQKVHSKSNQSTGNPANFYRKMGYVKTGSQRAKSRLDIDKINPDRKKIIDIFEKKA